MHALRISETTNPVDEISALRALLVERDARIAQLVQYVETLQQQFLNLRRLHFGATSEKFSGQAELFSEKVDLPLPPEPDKLSVPAHQRRRGRPALPEDLPRERRDYDLSEAEKAEFDAVKRIGEEISRSIEYTPARVVVLEHVRAKYACIKDGESTIRTAHAEASPLPKSNAGASLLAQILTATFADHLPLNRQEMIFRRHGIDLHRSTLCEYKLGAGELLAVLRAPLIAHVLAAPRMHSDDTTLPLLEKGRGSARTARLWGYLGAGSRQTDDGAWVEHAPAVVFEFTESREAMHPLRFLKPYSGYLQVDAYSGYEALFRSGRVIEVGCIAHARRRFFEIARTQKAPGLATEAIGWIAKLYEIEGRIKDEPPDKKLLARQAESVPLLSDFKRWLDGHYGTLLPQSPLGQAFGYAIRQWQALTRYTDNGILMPDNNLLERQMRAIAMGRKAYLFTASRRGGTVAATMYSLVATCKLNRIEPFAYLKDVLARIRSHRVDRLAELLPFNWSPANA
ncbi:MAG: IS66 family transposase [Rubrivivax sp.]